MLCLIPWVEARRKRREKAAAGELEKGNVSQKMLDCEKNVMVQADPAMEQKAGDESVL